MWQSYWVKSLDLALRSMTGSFATAGLIYSTCWLQKFFILKWHCCCELCLKIKSQRFPIWTLIIRTHCNLWFSCWVQVRKSVWGTLFIGHFYREVMTIVLILSPVTLIRGCAEKKKTMLLWQSPASRPSSGRHKAAACSLLMLHSSWNNPTVFQTPKWTPKLDNTPLPSPPPLLLTPQTHPLFLPRPTTNPPTTHSSHTRIPWSPVLIWVETFWEPGGRGGGGGETERGEREGVGLTQGRQEEKQWALAALS